MGIMKISASLPPWDGRPCEEVVKDLANVRKLVLLLLFEYILLTLAIPKYKL